MRISYVLVSVCAKFQFPSLPKSCLKVPGGGVVGWGGVGGVRSILVFSLSLSQAEQQKLYYQLRLTMLIPSRNFIIS